MLAQFFVNPLYDRAAEFFGYTIQPASVGLTSLVDRAQIWQFKYGLVAIPLILYGLLAAGQRFPGIGAIVNREVGPRHPNMPGYVAVPYASSIGLNPGYFGGNTGFCG